jgi:hypothetical protein
MFGRYTRTLEFNNMQMEEACPCRATKTSTKAAGVDGEASRAGAGETKNLAKKGLYMAITYLSSLTRHQNTCDNIQKLLGLYFQSMGSKRRVQQTCLA